MMFCKSRPLFNRNATCFFFFMINVVWLIIMEIKIIKEKIPKEELKNIVKEGFGTMAKVDVDVKRGVLSVGGEWHSEGDEVLSKDGSFREDIWGVNFYPWNAPKDRVEYVSLINIKPSLNHKNMEIKDRDLKDKIKNIIEKLLLNSKENMD